MTRKTRMYRLINKARQGNTTGQIEEQTNIINETTDRMFQEAANTNGMVLRNGGKVYYPRGR